MQCSAVRQQLNVLRAGVLRRGSSVVVRRNKQRKYAWSCTAVDGWAFSVSHSSRLCTCIEFPQINIKMSYVIMWSMVFYSRFDLTKLLLADMGSIARVIVTSNSPQVLVQISQKGGHMLPPTHSAPATAPLKIDWIVIVEDLPLGSSATNDWLLPVMR